MSSSVTVTTSSTSARDDLERDVAGAGDGDPVGDGRPGLHLERVTGGQ